MTPPDIFSRFVSLGENCEFALAQSKFGLRPFSLLAFAFNTLDGLALALADRLQTIDDPASFDVAAGAAWGPNGEREYILRHKTYGTIVHTHRFEGRQDLQELMRIEIDRLSYLREGRTADQSQSSLIPEDPACLRNGGYGQWSHRFYASGCTRAHRSDPRLRRPPHQSSRDRRSFAIGQQARAPGRQAC